MQISASPGLPAPDGPFRQSQICEPSASQGDRSYPCGIILWNNVYK
jgi:hypothetical protein